MPALGRSQVALEILAYLAENPTAQDTMVGIIEWWLLEQEIKTKTFAVKEALAELVASDLILERKGKDSQVHYSINADNIHEVLKLLARRRKNKQLSSFE